MNLTHMCGHRQIFIESWTNVWDYTELSLTLWPGHTGDHQTLSVSDVSVSYIPVSKMPVSYQPVSNKNSY